jgi:hypothetical protein
MLRGDRWRVGVLAALVIVPAVSPGPSTARACDVDPVVARANHDAPRYRVGAARAEHGIVTLVLYAREGPGAFAIALYASGSQLATSVMGVGVDSAELARATEPFSTWWQIPDVQRALVACSESRPPESIDAALRAAAEAAVAPDDALFRIFGRDVTWMGVGGLLCLALALGVLVGVWRSRDRLVNQDTPILLALTALAVLVRVIAHPGPANTREVINEVSTGRAGWTVLLHLIFSVLPMQDETIWTINRIAGALSVPLLYVVMRRRFADEFAAIGSAAAIAVTPLIARFSASDTPYILLCAALLGAVVAYDRYVETGSIGAMALGLGLLTAALQLRPEGPWLIVPFALLAASAGFPDRLLGRLKSPPVAICALLFVTINVIGTIFALRGNGQHLAEFVLIGSLFGSPWADPGTTSRMLAALVALGISSALIFRFRWAGWLWLAATLVALPLLHPIRVRAAIPVDGHLVAADVTNYAIARYHVPAMYLGCGLVGLGVATALGVIRRLTGRTPRAARLVAVAVVCIAAGPRVDFLWRMWTPQREFEFFRDGLRRIDPDCELVTVLNGMDAGFYPFGYLRQSMIDTETFLSAPHVAGCIVYYRAANCYALNLAPEPGAVEVQVNPTCRAIEERFGLEPIAEAWLPAVPYNAEVYTRDPLPVGFYRLHVRREGSRPG